MGQHNSRRTTRDRLATFIIFVSALLISVIFIIEFMMMLAQLTSEWTK